MENSSFSLIYVEKGKLLNALLENRDKHVQEYNQAQDVYNKIMTTYVSEKVDSRLDSYLDGYDKSYEEYKEGAVKALEQYKKQSLKSIDENKAVFGFGPGNIPSIKGVALDAKFPAVTKPESHEKEYNDTIKKVELSSSEKFSLGDQEFKQYILDDWSWKPAFSSSFHVNNIIGSGYFGNFAYNAISGISVKGF